jgi:hypothetical protein
LLNGSAFFVIPGIGQVLVAGPLVASIVNGMEDELEIPPQNALSAGLYHSKIRKDRLGEYESAVRGSKFVLFAHGTSFDTVEVSEVLTGMGHEVHAITTVRDPYTVEAPARVYVVEMP